MPEREFRAGVWRHYKGGLYTAICLVAHHETRAPMVLYVSHENGGLNVRPLHGVKGDPDGFLDEYRLRSDGEKQWRFEFVGSGLPLGARTVFP